MEPKIGLGTHRKAAELVRSAFGQLDAAGRERLEAVLESAPGSVDAGGA